MSESGSGASPRRQLVRAVVLVPLLVVVSLFGGAAASPAVDAADLEGFRAFMKAEMERWQVPGVGVGIVQDGEVVFAGGFGLRDVAKNLPVDADTVFAIGSASKAFTTMDVGILVDGGKVKWDERVRTYLPTFQLKDPVATDRMTVRDLVCHRLGLGRNDAVWYGSPLSRDELFARLRYLDFDLDFRDRFQYNNLGFLTAGVLVEEVSGMSWEDFTRQRIFSPLGMSRSNLSVEDSMRDANHSLPYMRIKGEVREVPFRIIDSVGPAGSINSSVNDVLRWIQLHLGKGTVGDTTIISEEGQEEMYTPSMALRRPMYPLDPDGQSAMVYGLGWFVETYRGHKVVHHGGSIDGFFALILYAPNDDVGAVVLTNLGETPLLGIAMGYVLDMVLDLDPVWPELTVKRWDEAREAEKKAEEAALEEGKDRVQGTRPSHPLAEYAGAFEHPAYGVMTIGIDGDALTANRNSDTRRLEHWHYDQFKVGEGVPFSTMDGQLVSFHTGSKGEIDRLSIPFDPTLPAIVFTRHASEE